MATSYGMYKKPLTNDNIYLMKNFFNLKMGKDLSVTMHLNKFSSIIIQMSSVEIEFNDEVRALIMFALLLNSWEVMRMVINNLTKKENLGFDDIWDLTFD